MRVKKSNLRSFFLLVGALLLLAWLATEAGWPGAILGLVVLGCWIVYDLKITFGCSTPASAVPPVVPRHSRTIP